MDYISRFFAKSTAPVPAPVPTTTVETRTPRQFRDNSRNLRINPALIWDPNSAKMRKEAIQMFVDLPNERRKDLLVNITEIFQRGFSSFNSIETKKATLNDREEPLVKFLMLSLREDSYGIVWTEKVFNERHRVYSTMPVTFYGLEQILFLLSLEPFKFTKNDILSFIKRIHYQLTNLGMKPDEKKINYTPNAFLVVMQAYPEWIKPENRQTYLDNGTKAGFSMDIEMPFIHQRIALYDKGNTKKALYDPLLTNNILQNLNISANDVKNRESVSYSKLIEMLEKGSPVSQKNKIPTVAPSLQKNNVSKLRIQIPKADKKKEEAIEWYDDSITDEKKDTGDFQWDLINQLYSIKSEKIKYLAGNLGGTLYDIIDQKSNDRDFLSLEELIDIISKENRLSANEIEEIWKAFYTILYHYHVPKGGAKKTRKAKKSSKGTRKH